MKWAHLLPALAVVSAASTARAAALDEAVAGARSYAMGGAHRGVGTSNDTLFLNPAGMAVAKRYGLEVTYGYTKADDQNHLSVSAVDSKSGPVAGGIAFAHVGSGVFTGGLNHFYLSGAYLISDAIAVGASLHYIHGGYLNLAGGNIGVNLYTGDVGVMAILNENLSIGVSYNNVVTTSEPLLTPATLGFGAALTFSAFTLAYDMTLGVGSDSDQGVGYHAGAEYFLFQQFPVRVGYARERVPSASGNPYHDYASGGLGYAQQGGALEVSYRQAFDHGRDWGIVGSLKLFL